MADEQDFDEHDDEEKLSEDPINNSTPSGPSMANNSNRTYNNQYNFKQHNKQYNNQYTNQYNNNSNLSKAPPAAFTFQPQQFQPFQPPLPEFSSQAAVPSPKTHFYSPNKFNAHNVHNKQSQSFSPLHSPPAMHHQSRSHPNIGLHVKHIKNIHQKNHPIVKQLVDMGFPQNYVERACKIFKKNFGSKPYRLEVLTEIILRLQRKDDAVKGQSRHVAHHRSHNKSLELLLNRHKDKIALEDSTTALIKNDVKFRRNSNSYIINKNKNNLILVQVITGPSITKTINEDVCEVHIKADQTLTDLKSLLSQLNKKEYIFYHESGFIFNDNNLTIRQCMNELSAVGYTFDDNTLPLKIGIFAQRKSSKKKQKIKPLPPRNMALPVTNMSVMGRNRSKSTKLDIIKSKIEIETNKNFREIITYIKDSPFWWKTMNEGTERVKKLTNRLKSIARLISELCQLLNKFSTHCNKLSMDVMKSWESIENEFCGDVLSLNAQFFNLGDTISTLSTSSAMLSMTLDKVIVEQFHEFCDLHLSKLLVSNKRLISMKNEYESELQYILHNKSEKGENNDNIRANKCENLRKLYELTRYDHCIILNNIINRHRYDIILDLCAAFCAFETFFHLGYEASLSHKQFHDAIRLGLSQKDKQRKIYFDHTVNKNRRILVETLSQGLEHNEYKKRIRAVNSNKNKANMKMIQFDPQEENEFIPKKDRIRFKHVSLDYYDGYLWKQSSKSKKKWQKRWFVLTNGELEYFRNPKERNKIKNKNKSKNGQNKEYIGNTALCKVKKAVEHDFNYVFSIITPSQRVYVLQAQTSNAYDEWFYVLSNQCARLILRKNTIDRFKRRRKEIEMKSYSINDQNNYIFVEKERLKKEILHLNKFCADCGRINPEWCSVNIGVLLCMQCCGVHRGLGTHISKMRSLKLDDVSVVNLKMILNIGGNEKLNGELLESCADGAFSGCEFFDKINCESCTAKERSNFIKNKYMFKMFLNPMQIIEIQQKKKNVNQLLWNAVANNDFFKVLYCLYYGADIDYQFEKYNNATVIHEAVQRNYTEMVQLLVHNEANVNVEDGNEQKANQIAIKESLNNIDNTEIQNILKTAVY